jgi:hypothetical protein
VTLVALLVLAAVLGASGAMKLLAPARAPTLASRLAERVPRAAFAVAALPFVEILLAAALLAPATRQPAALASLALLLSFSVELIAAWRRGDQTPCGCFGAANDGGTRRLPLARNAVLSALALAVLGGGPAYANAWALALGAFAMASAGTTAAMASEVRRLTRASVPQDTAPPAAALDFPLATTAGDLLTLRSLLRHGRSQLVVFVDPICGPCRALLPDLAHRQRGRGSVEITVVSRGPLDENAAMAREFGLATVAVQEKEGLSVRFGINATPTALLLSPDGQIAGGPASGRAAILSLLNHFLDTPNPAIAPTLGIS